MNGQKMSVRLRFATRMLSGRRPSGGFEGFERSAFKNVQIAFEASRTPTVRRGFETKTTPEATVFPAALDASKTPTPPVGDLRGVEGATDSGCPDPRHGVFWQNLNGSLMAFRRSSADRSPGRGR